MRLSRYLTVPFALALSGCSYSYDLLAVVIGGRLAFIVDPRSARSPDCLNVIEVQTDEEANATAEPSDDLTRVGYGTYWYERVSYGCKNPFPVFYGSALKGGPPEDSGVVEALPASEGQTGTHARPDHVKPKPLKVGVVYRIRTTTGATGYGSGAFRIRPNRTVENLPQ